MSHNSTLYIPDCRTCFGKSRMHIEPLHHKGDIRDHYRIICVCGNSTKPWLMPGTALRRWVGA